MVETLQKVYNIMRKVTAETSATIMKEEEQKLVELNYADVFLLII